MCAELVYLFHHRGTVGVAVSSIETSYLTIYNVVFPKLYFLANVQIHAEELTLLFSCSLFLRLQQPSAIIYGNFYALSMLRFFTYITNTTNK